MKEAFRNCESRKYLFGSQLEILVIRAIHSVSALIKGANIQKLNSRGTCLQLQ